MSREWKTFDYSRSQVIKAGKIIKHQNSDSEKERWATIVIDNFRAAHAYPMHVIYVHLRRMRGKRKDIIVAERLKRQNSIVEKIKREPNMNLWTMQDLGGCRVVVPTVPEVYDFAEQLRNSRMRHIPKDKDDYIANPKESGYRSLHLIYQFHSDNKESKYNNNMLVEIQLRTHYQHLWATAVETIGLFTGDALKSGIGPEATKRFFALASSVLALMESCPVVPGTSSNLDELISEMYSIDNEHSILDLLSGISSAVGFQKDDNDKQAYYLMALDLDAHSINYVKYPASKFEQANADYIKLEKQYRNKSVDVVLVSVDSFKALRTAYPNYFLDISEFVHIIKDEFDEFLTRQAVGEESINHPL